MLRRMMLILWPAFLVAILAEGLFFSIFDPHELTLAIGNADLPPMAAYTLGFFFFWLACGLSSLLTYYLINVPDLRTNENGGD